MGSDIFPQYIRARTTNSELYRIKFSHALHQLLKCDPYRIKLSHALHQLLKCDPKFGLTGFFYYTFTLKGKSLGKGTFEEMSKSGIDFSSLLKRDKEEEEEEVLSDDSSHHASHSTHHASHPTHHSSHHHLHRQISHQSHRERLDSEARGIGSQFSLCSIGTEFEVQL